MNFEIHHHIPSDIKIASLNVEGTDKENPDKWIRYITKSNAFEIRI